jgi:hypothetical protein
MVVRDRIREYTVHNLGIESLVREISAKNERAIRTLAEVVSQTSLIALKEL